MYVVFGATHLATCLFERKYQCLTIENGIITKHVLVPKQMELKEIRQIQTFCSEFILKISDGELRIDKHPMKEDSLKKLNSVLEGLDLGARLFEPSRQD